MQDKGIPEPVKRFLAANIHSIEQLEVLLLLRETEGREWSVPEVSGELRSTPQSIKNRLEDLASRTFLVVKEIEATRRYRYSPSTDEDRRLIDGLADAYKERRLTVINLIYARPERDALSFAEAFKIMKKKGDA
jgi:DNA-binding MarR family transcriptional regulator